MNLGEIMKKIEQKEYNPNLGSNHFQFFQDLEIIKEKLEKNNLSFPSKNEIIQGKQTSLIKKFIDEAFIKENSKKEIDLLKANNESQVLKNKVNLLNEELKELKNESKTEKDSLNQVVFDLKTKLKIQIEQLSINETDKKKILEEKDNELFKLNREMSQKEEIKDNKISYLENEIRQKENQILTNKLNDEKSQALSKQRIEFNEREIESLKERNSQLSSKILELKETIDDLNQKLKELENSQVKSNKENNQNREEDNDYKSRQIESLQNQLDETKKIYEDVINTLKENITTKDREDKNKQTDYKELIDSNKILSTTLGNYESRCKKLEDKLDQFKHIKNIITTGTGIQCQSCSRVYSLEIYKNHFENCKAGKMMPKQDQSQKDNFKIKILKGIICQDEFGKPYIEYILEISFNLQIWRINKKFLQFANFHKAILKQFPNLLFPESTSIFSNITDVSNNFHENKLKLLEKYIKELSLNDEVFCCGLFRKFIGFDEFNHQKRKGSNDQQVENNELLEDDEDDGELLFQNENDKNMLLDSSDDEKDFTNTKVINNLPNNIKSNLTSGTLKQSSYSSSSKGYGALINNNSHSQLNTNKLLSTNQNNIVNQNLLSNKSYVNLNIDTNSQGLSLNSVKGKATTNKGISKIKSNNPNILIENLDMKRKNLIPQKK